MNRCLPLLALTLAAALSAGAEQAPSAKPKLLLAFSSYRDRPRHLHARADLLEQLFGDLLDETRRHAVAVHTVQTALLGRNIDVMFATPPSVIGAVADGRGAVAEQRPHDVHLGVGRARISAGMVDLLGDERRVSQG